MRQNPILWQFTDCMCSGHDNTTVCPIKICGQFINPLYWVGHPPKGGLIRKFNPLSAWLYMADVIAYTNGSLFVILHIDWVIFILVTAYFKVTKCSKYSWRNCSLPHLDSEFINNHPDLYHRICRKRCHNWLDKSVFWKYWNDQSRYC